MSQDAAFKPRLLSLLAQPASIHDGAFLDTIPKLDLAATEAFEATLERGDATIGPYRLLREIGEGGMGAVWLAERADGMVRRPVALKLPRRAWLHASLAERMARERDILAALAHPHIARLYDAGVTADRAAVSRAGVRRGRPLDAYCRDERLDVRGAPRPVPAGRAGGRLRARQAGRASRPQAVEHPRHRRGPGHVLLDFGIAKLLDDGAADQTMLTEIAGRPLTPDYASPEQIAGEPLGVATDIYSLGVVLYELLAGTRPGQVERDAARPLRSALARTDVIPPSDAAGEPAIRKALRGDLDTIVLKALKESPEERYPTANAFGDDLRRCLSGRPVARAAGQRLVSAFEICAPPRPRGRCGGGRAPRCTHGRRRRGVAVARRARGAAARGGSEGIPGVDFPRRRSGCDREPIDVRPRAAQAGHRPHRHARSAAARAGRAAQSPWNRAPEPRRHRRVGGGGNAGRR